MEEIEMRRKKKGGAGKGLQPNMLGSVKKII